MGNSSGNAFFAAFCILIILKGRRAVVRAAAAIRSKVICFDYSKDLITNTA